jgi:hypothetical protein
MGSGLGFAVGSLLWGRLASQLLVLRNVLIQENCQALCTKRRLNIPLSRFVT